MKIPADSIVIVHSCLVYYLDAEAAVKKMIVGEKGMSYGEFSPTSTESRTDVGTA